MPDEPALLARGPWHPDEVEVHWSDDPYDAPPARVEAADAAIAALRDRGSPSHDGLAARLVSHDEHDGRLTMHLQPTRWALRLVEGDASLSVAALCVTRAADGRWLAGRRAPWLSSWAGRWALGAGGAVDVGESPVDTLTRELDEEWSVAPERVRCEALVRLPHRLVMFIGQAWLPEGADGDARPRARRLRVVAGVDRRLAARGRRAAAARWPACWREPAPFDTLKRLSFTHSAIYLTLLVVWIVPGLHALEFVFGMAHGLGWIAMCVLTLAAVRARVIPLRLGIAVAVIGAVGPFVGSYEFVREERRRHAPADATQLEGHRRHGRTGKGEASIRAY